MVKANTLSRLSFWACIVAFGVIGLGAFTRLVDAGLGCPDWPLCYGKSLIFQQPGEIDIQQFSGSVFVAYKAWAEMIHRYVAGILGFFILTIFTLILVRYKRDKINLIGAGLLLGLLIYQILLGQWTVTLKLLPIVVTQHLLGGFLILCVLWFIYLRNRPVQINYSKLKKLFPWAIIGFILIFFQIVLGAWTSTNYASLSCPEFPLCSRSASGFFQWREAFNIFSPIGINYEGGILPLEHRQAIQIIHRLGALTVVCYMFVFSLLAFSTIKQSIYLLRVFCFIWMLLFFQMMLGIVNVVYELPLATALLHNWVAVSLLLSMFTFVYYAAKTSRSK